MTMDDVIARSDRQQNEINKQKSENVIHENGSIEILNRSKVYEVESDASTGSVS